MCIFSQPVRSVSSTRIFAANHGIGLQSLAYQMTYIADNDLAMILPLPVPENTPEDGVQFVSLQNYPSFFDDMSMAFEPPRPRSFSQDMRMSSVAKGTLVVHEVGDFEASFVPTLDDFGRLDERFRLPRATWNQTPHYADFGFAVFKLKGNKKQKHIGFRNRLSHAMASRGTGTTRKVHPMAFIFPRREGTGLFFPTVHIHDGEVHSTETFDHELYFQADDEPEGQASDVEKSAGVIRDYVSMDRVEGLLEGDKLVYRYTLKGDFPNEDVYLF
jgi:hypothetical protein